MQADALRELDRFEALRIKSPPRTATAEWDWLYQVGQKERSRLAKQWYGGELAPDQVAAVMSDALGRDLSVDEAMELWLNLNRHASHGDAAQKPMDRGFIALLFLISLTGLALLAWRDTPAMAVLLAVHLGTVMALFVTLPYGKFAHGVFRTAALLKFAIEKRQPTQLALPEA